MIKYFLKGYFMVFKIIAGLVATGAGFAVGTQFPTERVSERKVDKEIKKLSRREVEHSLSQASMDKRRRAELSVKICDRAGVFYSREDAGMRRTKIDSGLPVESYGEARLRLKLLALDMGANIITEVRSEYLFSLFGWFKQGWVAQGFARHV